MAGYRQPRSLNPVSLVLYLALAAAAYGAFIFGPPYWRKWKVKEVLDDSATRYVGRRMMAPDAKAALARSLQEEGLRRLKALGVTDPAVRLDLTPRGDAVTVTADYTETIRHPLINKLTVLRFRPHVTREPAAGF